MEDLSSENKELRKIACENSTHNHASEILGFYMGLASLYERAFFSLLEGDTESESIRIAKNRVHESRYEHILEYEKKSSDAYREKYKKELS